MLEVMAFPRVFMNAIYVELFGATDASMEKLLEASPQLSFASFARPQEQTNSTVPQTLTEYTEGSMTSSMGRCWVRPPSGLGLTNRAFISPKNTPPDLHTSR